jgi:hypothetical protein
MKTKTALSLYDSNFWFSCQQPLAGDTIHVGGTYAPIMSNGFSVQNKRLE